MGVTARYECNTQSGALLALRDEAHAMFVVHNREWVRYVRENHEHWYNWATRTRNMIIDKEDIILVYGWYKANDWCIASFTAKGEALNFSLNAGVSPYAGLSILSSCSQEESGSPEFRQSDTFKQSPEPPTALIPTQRPPLDCIFLSAYRIKYRLMNSVRFLKAEAEPLNLSQDDDTTDHESHAAVFDIAAEDFGMIENTNDKTVGSFRTMSFVV